MQVTTIGLDIAKNVFQVHGIDAREKVVGLNGFAVGASLPGYGWGIYSGAGTELLV